MSEEDAVDLLTGTALRAYVGEQKTTSHTLMREHDKAASPFVPLCLCDGSKRGFLQELHTFTPWKHTVAPYRSTPTAEICRNTNISSIKHIMFAICFSQKHVWGDSRLSIGINMNVCGCLSVSTLRWTGDSPRVYPAFTAGISTSNPRDPMQGQSIRKPMDGLSELSQLVLSRHRSVCHSSWQSIKKIRLCLKNEPLLANRLASIAIAQRPPEFKGSKQQHWLLQW